MSLMTTDQSSGILLAVIEDINEADTASPIHHASGGDQGEGTVLRSKLALLVAVLLVVAGCGQQSQTTEAAEAQEPVDRVTTTTVLSAEEPSGDTSGEEAPGPQPPPDLSLVPDRTAPAALGTVELPTEPVEIRAVLAAMPESLAGEERVEIPQLPQPASRYDLGYGQVALEGISMGPRLHLTVIDVQSGDFFPTNWTGPDVIAFRLAFRRTRRRRMMRSLTRPAVTEKSSGCLRNPSWAQQAHRRHRPPSLLCGPRLTANGCSVLLLTLPSISTYSSRRS